MIYAPRLPRLGTFDAWRAAARALASNDIPPEQVDWGMEDAEAGLFAREGRPLPAPRAMTVPKDFVPLARLLCASRSAGAHDLLYRLLLRCRDTPRLLTNRADADVQRAEELVKNIRRDMHKMKAFVRFREVTPAGSNRRQFLSWFEPDHRIEELIAGFFTRRFGDMDWVIVTPEITMRFQAGDMTFETVASDRLDLSDETEELWKTYYAHIFNPARLKIKAMQSEMPKKYWKNLPEASLIPDLIAGAEARVAEMRAQAPTLAPARAGRILDRLPEREADAALHACTRCPLAASATQAVPGEGPADAALMIVGEQPGDREDLAGRPFVGPAGQLFDAVLEGIGLDRRAAYVTNAVKHFKFTPRGKRRIHQSPNRSEIEACRFWLTREIAQVSPVLVVAMGATAAEALTGDGAKLMQRRGRVERGRDGLPVLVTLHPSAVLRAADPAAMRALLAQDLAKAKELLNAAEAFGPPA
ncbi:UdgX family uracil-DNA binding protein [Sulfitobacter sp. HNIBRBA3233]|uniref:UdgX family uracil-DNA binding protein n=1 Tax=Sulfitobacter marinivivus TaxID=3158558 RepID=UPI0032DFB0C0